ncbi:fumarylacetoacetate hydrolase family protein [Mycobacterium camsae]|uniref:fumarylacetoacetate hydrolase family protein n=1 Tax=Mycobacterium gordonae TaxID=1778 RepID=UPI00197F880F|nr:fumarylacetoacetate hydrolase family protein [Mycobacterium gordonae]
MTTTILRTPHSWWIQTPTGATRIPTDATTTADLLADRSAINTARHQCPTTPVENLNLSSPVTAPCRIVAQVTNFASHAKDCGRNPTTTPLAFFRKASRSISGPFDDIIKPDHVQLLDYEIEIGLVVGRRLPVGTALTADNLAHYVAGLVIANDITARDIQLTKNQFYEAKSYPTFTPIGPALVLLNAAELNRFDELRLLLAVNGDTRQDTIVGNDILYPPLQALQTLTQFQPLQAGDIILTGTPTGTALTTPHSLLPPAVDWKTFMTRQANNTRYLRAGDLITATAATQDGSINLGIQRTLVRQP